MIAAGTGLGAAKAAAARKHINLPGKAATLPFSDAVRVGDTLYLA